MDEIKVKNILGDYITLTAEEVEEILINNMMLTKEKTELRKKVDILKIKLNKLLEDI